ncbi:unnamed protein product [Brassica rapa subsp. trilocularis]
MARASSSTSWSMITFSSLVSWSRIISKLSHFQIR